MTKTTFTQNTLKNLGKSHNFIELLPIAQSSSRNENIVSTSKNLFKNGNQIFPVVCYFST